MNSPKNMDIIQINGVKYQRILDEPKTSLYEKFWEAYLNYDTGDSELSPDILIDSLVLIVKKSIPKEQGGNSPDKFWKGFNTAVKMMRMDLK